MNGVNPYTLAPYGPSGPEKPPFIEHDAAAMKAIWRRRPLKIKFLSAARFWGYPLILKTKFNPTKTGD